MAFDRGIGSAGTGTSRGVVDRVATVETISDLKSYTGPEDAVIVQGYNTVGDGGGGEFYWDSTSTATADDGITIQATGVSTGRWIRIYTGSVFVDWFGSTTTGTQAALNYLDSLGGGKLEYIGSHSYTQGSVTVPSDVIVEGNNCTIVPDTTPAQCFLIASSSGNDRESIIIRNFIITGSVTDFIKFTGSYLWHNTVENIDHRSGTSNSIVKTEIIAGINPSGFRLKNLNALHTGVKYGWHSTADATTASFDHVDVDHIEMWPSSAGYPVYIGHVLSMNSRIDKLYHGSGSGAGGGVLHVNQAQHVQISNLWDESSATTHDMLTGSYQNCQIENVVLQCDTSTDTHKFVDAHMFNCELINFYFLDDNSSGYERDSSPPTSYIAFEFINDASAHISRDVRIDNRKGNFDYTHITNATGQGIYLTGKPGDNTILAEYTHTDYTSATSGIGVSPGAEIAEFSNWEWGYDEEGIEIVITGEIDNTNAKDIRFYINRSATTAELGRLDASVAGGFEIRARIVAHNDGSNKIRVIGQTIFNNAITTRISNTGYTFVRSDTSTSFLKVYGNTFNAADTLSVYSITVTPLRSTIR